MANYSSTKRVICHGSDKDGQNMASLTIAVSFLDSKHPPETSSLEGPHCWLAFTVLRSHDRSGST